MNRYQRQIQLNSWGEKAQRKIGLSRVLVIGVGGLGCPVLQYLVSCGVGTIGLMDGDKVSLSNLQRQVLFTEKDLGKNKAETAKKSLEQLNSEIELKAIDTFLTKENALTILANYDLIVEGSDNYACKYLVNDACVILNKPWVSGSIEEFTGQLSVFNYKGGPSYRCLFPEQGNGANCNEIGVLGTLPGLVGTLMANEVLKLLTDVGSSYSGKLLQIDALNNKQICINFQRNENNFQIKKLGNYERICSSDEVSWEELKERMETGFRNVYDVRESDEWEQGAITDKFIPLSQLKNGEIPKDLKDDMVLYCQSGKRSLEALEILKSKGFKNVKSLMGGYNKWLEREHS